MRPTNIIFLQNLIGDPKYGAIAAEFDKQMQALMEDAGAPGDPDAVAACIASGRPVQ